MSTWQLTLENLLRQQPPQRLLVRGATLWAWADAALIALPAVARVDAPPADLALLGMPELELAEIARLRDRCPRLIVLSETSAGPDFNAFLALGFERLYHSPEDGIQLYGHDIATYKSVPDWLNAQYWAHPERWEP